MQDNLEFLQWSKRYWDQYYPGGDYDAVARRKGSGAPPATAPPQPIATSRTSAGTGATAARRGNTPTATSAARGKWTSSGGSASAAVTQENVQLKETVVGLERERDFYFSKLRDIELLIQNAVDLDPEIDKDEDGLIKHIQQILYSTEVGSFLSPTQYGGLMNAYRFSHRRGLRYLWRLRGWCLTTTRRPFD
jgi:microtubule-associated protein, RP/EB family